jgi:hypothetical protein
MYVLREWDTPLELRFEGRSYLGSDLESDCVEALLRRWGGSGVFTRIGDA